MNELTPLVQIQYCFEATLSQISYAMILYSHIPTALAALAASVYLVIKKRNPASTSLLAISLLFALWSFLDLNVWSPFLGASNTMFTWSLIDLVGLFFFFFAYRFLYAFVYEKDLPTLHVVLGTAIILPTLLSTFFGLNLTGYDAAVCEAVENETFTWFTYIAQALFIVGIVCLGTKAFWETPRGIRREQNTLATVGVLLFLTFFFSATFVVNMLVTYTTIPSPYNYEIYGLFGMPILLMFLGYLIVKYQAFNIKLIAAQAIVTALVLVDASQVFFSSTTSELVVNIITIILVVIFGYFLTRSVKREIAARERNEELAKDLARANARLRELDRQKSEFVSIASHQLRSPLTSIRGYASMLSEGSYGKLPQKAQDVVERVLESSTYMATSIEDFLNVSRIEQGRMKYENADIVISDMVSRIVDEMRAAAIKKGLALMFRSQHDGKTIAYVDPGKMRQVIYNLIDNAMKYTPKGSIDVIVSDDTKSKTITITVKDTGVGMSEETLHAIFDKFVRAKNANQVNVSGTGLGLYVAKQMIEAMGGKITPASEGEGKGSTFNIELPMVS